MIYIYYNQYRFLDSIPFGYHIPTKYIRSACYLWWLDNRKMVN